MAVKHEIPLIIWGEHGFMDLAGMYSHNDRDRDDRKYRLEHAQRGYDWYDMVGETEGLDASKTCSGRSIRATRRSPRSAFAASTSATTSTGSQQTQTELMRCGFEESPEPFERTYRRMSNLDDMHENGIHDYLKYIKFGYGRGTDHACKDIRAGLMTREEGVEMVRRYDHVKPAATSSAGSTTSA